MPRISYPSEMRTTEHGSRIYAYWRKIHRTDVSPEFAAYPDFYKWAMANGYSIGAKLFRHEIGRPYSPENCFWVPRSEWVDEKWEPRRDRDMEQKWDDTVNRIRVHYGMEPIHSSEVQAVAEYGLNKNTAAAGRYCDQHREERRRSGRLRPGLPDRAEG